MDDKLRRIIRMAENLAKRVGGKFQLDTRKVDDFLRREASHD